MGDAAGEQPGVGLDGNALRIAVVHAGHMHAGRQQARRAFQEHQSDWRIHELQRTVRARRQVGGAVGVAPAGGAGFAVGVECGAKGGLAERGAVAHERGPGLRPAQVDNRRAWQAEGEVECPQPWPGAGAQGLEARPVRAALEAVEHNARAIQMAAGHGDRLRATRGGGEVDAEQLARHRRSSCRITRTAVQMVLK